MNDQLVEIASWRVICELHRRYPNKFKVIETHPGGGQYDCLSIYDKDNQNIVHFNRAGRMTVFKRFDGRRTPPPFDIWSTMCEQSNQKEILNKVSDLIGLPAPSKIPASTPTTLAYRFIAELLTHGAFSKEQWECRNGYEDTSGYGGGVSPYFNQFPAAQEKLRLVLQNDFLKQPAYRFWFLCKDGRPLLCIETTGQVWNTEGKVFDLPLLYAKKHSICFLIAEIAGDCLP